MFIYLFDIRDTFKNKLYILQIASDIAATWTTMPKNQQISLIGIALQQRHDSTKRLLQQLRANKNLLKSIFFKNV